jgi:hypothetical protein
MKTAKNEKGIIAITSLHIAISLILAYLTRRIIPTSHAYLVEEIHVPQLPMFSVLVEYGFGKFYLLAFLFFLLPLILLWRKRFSRNGEVSPLSVLDSLQYLLVSVLLLSFIVTVIANPYIQLYNLRWGYLR